MNVERGLEGRSSMVWGIKNNQHSHPEESNIVCLKFLAKPHKLELALMQRYT